MIIPILGILGVAAAIYLRIAVAIDCDKKIKELKNK